MSIVYKSSLAIALGNIEKTLQLVHMLLGVVGTVLFGSIAFSWGMRVGRVMLRNGATANDMFRGKDALSLAFLGVYVALTVLALHVPQWQGLPIEWRVYGMQVTWLILRVLLLGMCGAAFIVSWRTARLQVIAVILIGVLGLGAFSAAEGYFLAPIYASLTDRLLPNGVFLQTSTSSCAPAAMATVLRRWGMDVTESSVARLAETSRLGTSMPQLIVAAQKMGLDGIELSPTWEQMQQINRPGVLGTWLIDLRGRNSHATALLGLNNNIAAIADPALGKIFYLNRLQLDRIWRKQYVPFFRPEEVQLTPTQIRDYLQRSGYLANESEDVTDALKRFQAAMNLDASGELDPETALMLTGPFIEAEPRLDRYNF